MGSLLAPGGDEYAHPDTRWARSLAWYRHRNVRFVWGLSIIYVMSLVTFYAVHLRKTGALVGIGVCVAVIIALITCDSESRMHHLRWCDECAWERVAEPGAEGAAKHSRALKGWHFVYTGKSAWAIRLLYALVYVVVLFMHGLAGALVVSTVIVMPCVGGALTRTHSVHWLWCPGCGHGDGPGDTEPVPDWPQDPDGEEIEPPKLVKMM